MSELQESVPTRHVSPGEAGASAGEGLRESAYRMIWGRVDWARPVGYWRNEKSLRMTSTIRGLFFTWTLLRINKFWLEHRTALLLLQGRPLTALLIPNQSIRTEWNPAHPPVHDFAHVLLRTDPWEFWQSAPALTNLVLAKLDDIPAGLSSAEVLAELAERSLH